MARLSAAAAAAALIAGLTTVDAQKCIDNGWRNPVFVRPQAGPEDITYDSICQPWASNTCCTANYTRTLDTQGIGGIYPGFSYDFCGTISDRCRQFMLWEECFYACDPYTAKFESTSFPGSLFEAPLCQNFCDDWYDACKNDFTCSDQWDQWAPENGTYSCSSAPSSAGIGAGCRKFGGSGGWFSDGTQMCTRMWGSNFKVSADPKKCFAPWFYSVNPNAGPGGYASSASSSAVAIASAVAVGAAILGGGVGAVVRGRFH